MKASVDANLFRLAYSAVSTEQYRYYLNGVSIEPHPEAGAIMVSTDGHRMVVIHDREGFCDEKMIVKLPAFALAQCVAPKMFETTRRLLVDGPTPGSATIQDTAPGKKGAADTTEAILTAHRVLIDGTFPDWRRVMPIQSAPIASTIAFNSKYLKAMGDLGEKVGKAVGGAGMVISQTDAQSPVVVRWSGADHIFAILMPLRVEVKGYLPSFMEAKFKEAAE